VAGGERVGQKMFGEPLPALPGDALDDAARALRVGVADRSLVHGDELLAVRLAGLAALREMRLVLGRKVVVARQHRILDVLPYHWARALGRIDPPEGELHLASAEQR